jgi:hypothetical protein
MWLTEVAPAGDNSRDRNDPCSWWTCPSLRDLPSIRQGPLLGLVAGGVDELAADEQPDTDREQHDHDRSIDELGEGELPGDQQCEDDADFDHQVGRRDLERHRRSEACPFAEQRPCQRHRGIRTRRGSGTQSGRLRQRDRSSSPGVRTTASRRTTAWTTADNVNPSMRDQVTCHVIVPAMPSASPIASTTFICNDSFAS